MSIEQNCNSSYIFINNLKLVLIKDLDSFLRECNLVCKFPQNFELFSKYSNKSFVFSLRRDMYGGRGLP